MSYYMNIKFAEVRPEDVLEKIADVKNTLWEQREQIVSDNSPFCPANKGNKDKKENQNWITDILKMQVIYWKEYNLLGIMCEGTLDDFKEVEFQNSCDQDYEFSYWPEFEFFKNEIQAVQNLEITPETLGEYYDEDCETDDDYHRRWMAYRNIFKKLCLNEYMYQKPGNFQRFEISVYDHPMDTYDLLKMIHHLMI